jgi:hypothetical protein
MAKIIFPSARKRFTTKGILPSATKGSRQKRSLPWAAQYAWAFILAGKRYFCREPRWSSLIRVFQMMSPSQQRQENIFNIVHSSRLASLETVAWLVSVHFPIGGATYPITISNLKLHLLGSLGVSWTLFLKHIKQAHAHNAGVRTRDWSGKFIRFWTEPLRGKPLQWKFIKRKKRG